ncbi:MAG TPA: serine/threonine-protein kinase [Kofleriaceae bacterium]|jgi:serine/threonine-protein kinase
MANSAARAGVDVGSVIADTYTIEAVIGRGGMGAVFLASHRRLPGKKVAIKLLHAEVTGEETLARFKREAEIASRLGHPNIVTVHDFNVTADGEPYLVLEYLQGDTLAGKLRNGPLPLDQVYSIVRQVGSALAAAHREGIVHRDLKPQNIFLVPTTVDGRRVEIAKVLDFGISKIRGSQTVQTQEATLLGTPQYMAPEQATGQHTLVDERTDVFAFGAIVYELLAGHPAFSGASIPEVVFKVVYEQAPPLATEAPTAPPHAIAAVEKAMAKAREERFPTVAAFVEALTGAPLLEDVNAPIVPPPAPDAGFASGSRHIANNDAFAQTMGSDPGSAVPPISASRAVGSSTGAGALDATVAPVSATAPPAPAVAAAPVVATAPTQLAPAKKHRAVMFAAIAVAVLAVGGLGYLLATRKPSLGTEPPPVTDREPHHATKPPAPPTNPAEIPDAAVVLPTPPDAAVAVAPPDAVVVVAAPPDAAVATTHPTPDAAVATTHPTPHPPAPHPPTPVSEDDPSSDDPTVAEQLQKADAALSAENFDLAERLANSTIQSSAPARQKAHAHAIRGIAACAHNDQEHAQADLRAIGGFPRIRARLVAACRARGVTL